MMWWGDGGWGMGSWLTMSMAMLAFWGAFVAVGVWAVRNYRSGPDRPERPIGLARADRELAERFARGEIDEAQFTRSRAVLHCEDGPS
jgi:putative membrane protein